MDYLTVDYWQYTKSDGAKLEPVFTDDYPMATWTIDLMESDNRYSDMYNYTLKKPNGVGIGHMVIAPAPGAVLPAGSQVFVISYSSKFTNTGKR
jgi:hypothetical protein